MRTSSPPGWSEIIAILALICLGSACGSPADSVCEDVGACSHGGDTDWIEECKSSAMTQLATAKELGCHAAFERYYECADEHYVCNGATARFPSCDGVKSAAEACLAGASTPSACASLTMQRSGCFTVSDQGDVQFVAEPDDKASCDLHHECLARCYLNHVDMICSPSIDELSALSDCSSYCL